MNIQQTTLIAQIALLEQVQQQSAQSTATTAARTRRQTRAADERLRAWGEWTARAIRGEGGYIRSLAGDLTGLGCGGSTNPDANGMPDGIFDTDRAVQQLTDRQRDAVEMEYLHSDLLQEQRARRLGVAVKAYEKLLSRARLKIFQALYVPSGGACSRLLNRRCEKSG